MKKIERAETILKELKKLYPSPPIPLDHTNAFTLLVAAVSYTHLTLPTTPYV